MGWEEYEKWQKSEGVKLLKKCGICEEMNVLDFGCSIGEYSIPASIAVGDRGNIVSVDKNIHRVKTLQANCVKWNLSNIHVIKGTENNNEINKYLYDCVLYFDLYHEFGKDVLLRSNENKRILKLITQTLKSEGLLLVSVFSEMCLIWDEKNGERTPKGFLKAQRVSIEDGIHWFRMIETIEECGFKLQKNIKDTVHFDEFYKNGGQPDMNKLERGNIYVFTKQTSLESTIL